MTAEEIFRAEAEKSLKKYEKGSSRKVNNFYCYTYLPSGFGNEREVNLDIRYKDY